MDLDAWLDRIGSMHPKAWDLGLDRVRDVAGRMNLLQVAPTVITVAGTNGKGSTCEVIAALCAANGLKAGKTTSPHLIRFNERIVIDGEPATDAEICEAFEAIDNARDEISLTYFEFAALAALSLFRQHQVDVAILEVGLGGRLDAMNIVDPGVAVITRIALDHQSWLGDTREAIALEKAGIMRQGRSVVIADAEPPETLLQAAKALNAPALLIGHQFGHDTDGTIHAEKSGERIEFVTHGEPALPVQSLVAGIQAAILADIPVDQSMVDSIWQHLRLAGRFQEIDSPRRTIFDVGHNPDSAAWLARRLAAGKSGRCLAVFGMYQDKDHAAVITRLAPLVDAWYLCQVDEPRAAPADELAAILAGIGGSVIGSYGKVADAYDQALEDSLADDMILVFGSFPIVGTVLEHLGVPV